MLRGVAGMWHSSEGGLWVFSVVGGGVMGMQFSGGGGCLGHCRLPWCGLWDVWPPTAWKQDSPGLE